VSERRERRFEAETLIGREREFARLYTHGSRPRREPRMVAYWAIRRRKTTLTNAFVSTCQMEGAAIARAQAYEAERELPFAVLASWSSSSHCSERLEAPTRALSELTRVSPEIFTAFPGVPSRRSGRRSHSLTACRQFSEGVEAATEEIL